ncbi:UNVERIFIED_CONTAM: hypothetical protein K2H54_035253 [Gekko kuhli]
MFYLAPETAEEDFVIEKTCDSSLLEQGVNSKKVLAFLNKAAFQDFKEVEASFCDNLPFDFPSERKPMDNNVATHFKPIVLHQTTGMEKDAIPSTSMPCETNMEGDIHPDRKNTITVKDEIEEQIDENSNLVTEFSNDADSNVSLLEHTLNASVDQNPTCSLNLDAFHQNNGMSEVYVKKVVHLIQEEFALGSYWENTDEALAMVSEKFGALDWEEKLLASLYEAANGKPAPPERPLRGKSGSRRLVRSTREWLQVGYDRECLEAGAGNGANMDAIVCKDTTTHFRDH